MARYDDAAWRESMRPRIDYCNMMAPFLGENGFAPDEFSAMEPVLRDSARRMEAQRDSLKWRALPFAQGETVLRILSAAKRIRETSEYFVVLGIGGSALGPIAVQQALSHLRYNDLPAGKRPGPKLYVEDNVDPERMASLLDVIELEKTTFNIITKSGSTSETMAQLLFFTDLLKEKLGGAWTEHVVATTDESKGNLIKIARENGLETFFVPDGVGGRFSELCPVGLLAAAVCGIDIEGLLAGAAYMDGLCSLEEPFENPACTMAALSVLAMKKGLNISVLMPYADSLKYISDWYAQLWAESLGKLRDRSGKTVRTGQTPVKALGVTDQHSQVQLYTEGPFDKVVIFLSVGSYRAEVEIPGGFGHIPDVGFLSGHSFNELIRSELTATEYAVTASGHANMRVELTEVNPFTVGALLYLLEMATAFAGDLLGIDAFDQPGVEEGKRATYALLGKDGYDEKRRELSALPERESRFTV